MNKHFVFGISGRCQSGKTTSAKYILENCSLADLPFSRMEIIHFADELKRICKEWFGLTDYQLNDDVGKNTPTHIKWRDIPGCLGHNFLSRGGEWPEFIKDAELLFEPDPGAFMTGREFMEIFGTYICRRINPRCWINALESHIKKQTERTIYVVADVRSPNEVDSIYEMGGYVQRLSRNPENRQTQIERNLDPDKFDWNRFSGTIDNRMLTLEEKNNLIFQKFLESINEYR